MRISMMIAACGTVAALAAPNELLRGQATAPAARAYTLIVGDRDRPMLGVTTGSSGARDTLGLLVQSVTSGGPAEKAGIEEGDRLVAVNGVNLRLAREDAEDEAMGGVLVRRLTRELAKHKAGEEVELRVYHDGQTRTVRAALVAAGDLTPALRSVQAMRTALEDRSVLGVSLGGSGSRRDTLGILVVGVTDSGPAANAGIEEGDRIAAVNGTDLRVQREDAGDAVASNARQHRFGRVMEKVKPGDDVELRVYGMGQTRTVHVKAVHARDLRRTNAAFFFDGSGISGQIFPSVISGQALPSIVLPARPRIRIQTRQGVQLNRIAPLSRATIVSTAGETWRAGRTLAAAATPAAALAPRAAGTIVSTNPEWRPSTRGGFAMAAPRTAVVGPSRLVAGVFGIPGLDLAPVDGELATYFGRGSERGLLVLSATSRWSGINDGDVILSIDGRPVRAADGSTSLVFRDGQPNVVELLRNGKRVRITLQR
jgi:serine protease Do